MSRLEAYADQFADLMNEARRLLTWRQRQQLMALIDQRLEAERDRDDQDEAA